MRAGRGPHEVGRQTGLYFEWLHMYTKALVWPAVVGSMLYAWQTMNQKARRARTSAGPARAHCLLTD